MENYILDTGVNFILDISIVHVVSTAKSLR